MADKKRLLIIGVAFCILAGLVLFTPLPVRAGAPQERHFRVEASSYEYAPSILQVNPGDRVILTGARRAAAVLTFPWSLFSSPV